MKSQNFVGFFLIYLISLCAFSQNNQPDSKKKKSEFWKNVHYGGNVGLDFSNSLTSINISPSAIYNVNNYFSTGAGVNFGYTNFRTSDITQFNYGLSLINLYNPINELQLSAELEYTFVNESQKISEQKITRNFNFPALHIGAGYRRGNFAVGLRYDLLYNEDKSIYSSPISPFARIYF